MEGWTCIFTTNHLHEAELIKGMLEEHQIVAITVNKQDSVYLIGDVELYVNVDEAFLAMQIINKLNRE
jgi:PHD/YefM family antitoxin component YafN of YafNO toxin-antitoxin module